MAKKAKLKKPLWKDIWNSESPNSNWEIWNGGMNITELKKDTIVLHYVPEDDYSKKDIFIKMPLSHFKDLINFIKRLDTNDRTRIR